ncbi:hypothetical protein [Anaeromyxobacter diazotrophicus]|uniref:Outer membrane protein beta-barrel domain-containing protein n=1 Tax=Anaeromyxobacter diazotrophicus TaxID=2590199 RepID=A0A7I9VGG5_9BACT|nr:hypothetical protein [Anaeromyxobacter diazotrophicus]GEJ55481.1 hypothetical protein AMYX_02220 [Anaeromyxobacter diazotrophicus]
MIRPGNPALLLVALLAAPSAADALGPVSLTLEGFGGAQRTDPLQLAGGTASVTPTEQDRLSGDFGLAGASVIAKASFLEVGLSFDTSFSSPRTKVSTLAPLAGLAFDVSVLRFELLAEWGGHRYGTVGGSGERMTVGFVGARPGLSVRLPLAGSVRWVLGVWGFSRWNLSAEEVAVPAPAPAVGATIYRAGRGPTFGVAGRLGLEL